MIVNTVKKCLSKAKGTIIFLRTLTSTVQEVIKNDAPSLPNHNTRILKVAIIGMPNAGKSTLINSLMDRKVCATSPKVHTTRGKANAIFTENDTQVVIIDTPGLVSDRERQRFSLEKAFMNDSQSVAQHADFIGVIHDVAHFWTRDRLDVKIIKLLEANKSKGSFLIFNKVDALKSKRKLLDLTRQITENCLNGQPIPGKKLMKVDSENRGWPYFQEIFMVSALTGDGLQDIQKYLIKNAKPGKWMFPEEVWTDQSAETLILNTIKAVFLDFLAQEMPYVLKSEVEYFNIDEKGVMSISVIVKCPSARLAKLIGGTYDGRLKQITERVQSDLQDTFKNFVRIKIVLKSPEKPS